ncbi:valine--tRNA ligase [Candidatus Uhrbacteria bacterium RIFCSPHIGHO2_02_FULL_47_44]|uniref:Valine--tRNA ligase n=1 Tax=Candidatus Uhrbacteria bacterium RIFCSPLOWO2_02_FULL_48_18 TaxID=1802408 RepID=A0A1F7V6T6_9BACT|nr:MAG: valine--tRNA ligase [Candidatus Uhrbacteria bacterium RIFCSPHIGHO2_01_FULL_47_10]OGL69995.1 MAG: valine--tRNA ligase [Candidatus Uhrbacteria bacterium RIFCSPHIGHO2_02_FULL_47_44]OGL80360.1 MAG: valine--tRNA ligase [Candidatus Uhrbacteria bacterium RIFCSPLOWO2_01_FULL_47_17]OGL86219.1 MAG: valine--tRNA ligase [Candidatus Uhrbacteria bacterium RIFCSPLOWO2_02_FULL_48_18]OGL93390.1 MAG: valine--tRNA ligase [Candidatus Uhrbacteria bacterium RIFCSPLOWO2_12_FULL_47_9]
MPNNEMPKAYESKLYEDEIYAAWEKSGFFNPDNLAGEPYSIMMPPPNVTGVLHLGHALENALMDAMARYQRLNGKKVLLVPGTDHAALPTQAKVEKMLMEGGMKNPRQELGRDKLVEKIREFAEASRSTILGQIKKMGTSCDWSRLAYTFDDSRNIAVNELFRRLYNDGLIYRGYRVVNWSTKGQSTCSDDEIEYIERASVLYTFKYSKDFPITIATTRPETKLGDTAVAVHPGDERYQKYIGQTFVVDVGAEKPLEIKVIADEGVDPTFGTGALGVTPAHSQVDFLMYEKQKVSGNPIGMIQVVGIDGKMTKEAGSYAGLTVEEARAKFVGWLSTQGLLEKEPEEIVQNVGTHSRYKDVIEVLPMTQWWLDVQKVIPSKGKSLHDLMAEALTTGLDGDASKKVTITPERFTKLYLARVANLRDWCLSRQTWWGHRIPVWYRGEETFVGNGSPEGDGWEQDPDTLDTWFSSGSWTFSTLGWPEKTVDLQAFHPTSWMQMGYEILYLWLMRMVLMSTYALGEIPFKDAYIHGMLRNESGKKFSKSDANGIDPLDIIEKYGCDALRLCVLSGNTPGNDSRFSVEKIESSRNFVNKMWNISRFILMSVGDTTSSNSVAPTTVADHWILGRLETVTNQTGKLIEQFDFSLAIETLREFIWNDFADWYLEIAKIQQKDEALKTSTNEILLYVLKQSLILCHPFMPFVSEAIWKEFGTGSFVMVEKWPKVNGFFDEASEKQLVALQELIIAIRNVRSQYKIEPKKLMDVVFVVNEASREFIELNREVIAALARVNADFVLVEKYEAAASDMSVVLKDVTVFVKMETVVDAEKEKVRVEKEIAELTSYLESVAQKLSNEEFRSKAPEKIIAQMEEKQREAQEKLKKLST